MFKEVCFPKDLCISYQSTMGEQFNTRVTAPGGVAAEGRTAEWGENSRHVFEPITNLIGLSDLERLQGFHALVQGRAYAFLIEWPGDNYALDSLIDTSAGGTSFQLRKEYRVPVYNYDESATPSYLYAYKPIQYCIPQTCFITINGVAVPVAENPVYSALWNGILFNEGNQSASVSKSGVITLASSITSSDELRASVNFLYVVRAQSDEMRVQLVSFGAYSVTWPLIEVFGEAVE